MSLSVQFSPRDQWPPQLICCAYLTVHSRSRRAREKRCRCKSAWPPIFNRESTWCGVRSCSSAAWTSGILVARSTTRSHEIATRLAVGGRSRHFAFGCRHRRRFDSRGLWPRVFWRASSGALARPIL